MIMSHIRYGITVWHHGQVALRKKIQACANKFLRMIYFMSNRESVKPLMNENKILSVNQIFHLEIAKIMQRVTLKTIPVPFTDIFQNQLRTTTMVTRCSSNFFQLFTSFQKCQQSISYTGPKIWNALPLDIKGSPEMDTPNQQDNPSIDNDSLFSPSITPFMKQFKNRMKKFALESLDFF